MMGGNLKGIAMNELQFLIYTANNSQETASFSGLSKNLPTYLNQTKKDLASFPRSQGLKKQQYYITIFYL